MLLSEKSTNQGKPNIFLSDLDFFKYIVIDLDLTLMLFVDYLFGKASLTYVVGGVEIMELGIQGYTV